MLVVIFIWLHGFSGQYALGSRGHRRTDGRHFFLYRKGALGTALGLRAVSTHRGEPGGGKAGEALDAGEHKPRALWAGREKIGGGQLLHHPGRRVGVKTAAEIARDGLAGDGHLPEEGLQAGPRRAGALPIRIAAGAPVAQVGRGDGAALENTLQHAAHLGQTVEPHKNGGRGLAVIEAAVEGITDFNGETSDLAGAGGGGAAGRLEFGV